jgi:hypothetical protein
MYYPYYSNVKLEMTLPLFLFLHFVIWSFYCFALAIIYTTVDDVITSNALFNSFWILPIIINIIAVIFFVVKYLNGAKNE